MRDHRRGSLDLMVVEHMADPALAVSAMNEISQSHGRFFPEWLSCRSESRVGRRWVAAESSPQSPRPTTRVRST
jgi:hypothetical protein